MRGFIVIVEHKYSISFVTTKERITNDHCGQIIKKFINSKNQFEESVTQHFFIKFATISIFENQILSHDVYEC